MGQGFTISRENVKYVSHNPSFSLAYFSDICIHRRPQIPPARVPDPSGSGKMISDFWDVSKKKLLSDPDLLRKLKEFDKENFSEDLQARELRTKTNMHQISSRIS